MGTDWKKVFRGLLWIAALSLLTAVVVLAARRQNLVVCRAIQYQMLDSERFVTVQEIRSLLHADRLIYTKISKVEMDTLEAHVRRNPFVDQIHLSVDLSGVLKVTVLQKHPFLMVTNQFGQRFFVDRRGYKMPYFLQDTSQFFHASGKIREGFNGLDTLHSPELKSQLALALYIDRRGSKIKFHSIKLESPGRLALTPRNEPVIVLGDTSSLDEKFFKLELLYSTIFPKQGMDTYSAVDLRFSNQLVCELKQPSGQVEDTLSKPASYARLVSNEHTTKPIISPKENGM